MKVIVIGPSLSGKTTLVRYLRQTLNLPIAEMDEKLTNLNGGTFPLDAKYKHEILAPKIIEEVLKSESIIFFTNTDYFTMDDLRKARTNGFRVILLSLALEQLLARNAERMNVGGYEDMSRWLPGMLRYEQEIRDEHLADQIINANLSTEHIAENIKSIL